MYLSKEVESFDVFWHVNGFKEVKGFKTYFHVFFFLHGWIPPLALRGARELFTQCASGWAGESRKQSKITQLRGTNQEETTIDSWRHHAGASGVRCLCVCFCRLASHKSAVYWNITDRMTKKRGTAREAEATPLVQDEPKPTETLTVKGKETHLGDSAASAK